MGSKQVHNTLLLNLEARLKKKEHYNAIDTLVEYHDLEHTRVLGEVDVLTIRYHRGKIHLYFFEVKSSNTIKNYERAVEQLHRHRDLLGGNGDVIRMFYYSFNAEGDYVIEQVK